LIIYKTASLVGKFIVHKTRASFCSHHFPKSSGRCYTGISTHA